MNKKKCTVLEGENFERPKQKISNEDSANFPVFPTGEGSGSNLNYKPGAAKQGIFTVNVVQLLQYDGVLLWIKINRFVIWKISWSTAPLYCLKIASRKA